jgi:hypothetical protein
MSTWARRSGVAWRVIGLDPQNSGRYVLLANLLDTACRWEDVGGVRRLMDEWNVSKEDGRSVIEVHREVCQFQCGSLCHPQAAEVYGMVIDMMSMNEGSRPRVTRLQDTRTCCTTSLAIAFGLLHTSPSEWRHHAHQQEPAGLP